jgi:hypothetical protein
MAKAKATTTHAASTGGDKVKMVQRHTEYEEVDVEASQEAAAPPDMSGKNPFRERTAQWMAWENRKRQLKGLPATNNL